MSNRIAPKLLAEFIGTFAFVFIGAGAAAVVGDGVGLPGIAAIAFAHGLTIMAFAFAYGSVSGGHMNPAVTVGVLAAGAMRARRGDWLHRQPAHWRCRRRAIAADRPGRCCHRPRHARTRAQPRPGRHVPHDHARCRLHDRGCARLFPGHGRTQHCGRRPRRQPRTARDRNDADIQHPHGRSPHGRPLQPGAGAWPDGRDR